MGERKRLGIALVVIYVACLWAWHAWAAEHTIVTFLTWKPSIPAPWERLIRQFEAENPDIRIRRQVGPQSSTQFHAIIGQRLKNRDPSVDVFFVDVIWPPEFASAGWVLDLTSRFTAKERSAFLGGPVTANTYHDKIYGIPSFLDAGLLFYRKDLLQKYGFDPPKIWNEMLAQGERILKGEQDRTVHIYSAQFKQYEGLVCNMMEFIWSNGGAVLEPRSGKVSLSEPPALEVVTFVRDRIIGKAAPLGALSYEEPESLALFVQGKALFHRNWPYTWTVANDPERSKVAGRVGVVSLPTFEGHSAASTLGGWQLAINRWSKHPGEAWRFVQFMTSYESQKVLALEAGRAPTRKAVYQDPEVHAKVPHLIMFLPAFERARPRPLSPVYPMISQELQRFFSRAISDPKSDIPALAKQAAARIERFARIGTAIQR